MKKYEILKYLPPYGPMYVPISENGIEDYSEGFVVRFFKSDNTNWVANFQVGWTDFNYVHTFDNSNLILIIAGGTCYIINPDEQKPKNIIGVGFKSILEKENGGIVLEDFTKLTIVEPNGEYWHTEQISFDGLVELRIEKNIVSGLACEPTSDEDLWVDFSVDLDSREISGGSYNLIFGEKKRTDNKKRSFESKPWWKKW